MVIPPYSPHFPVLLPKTKACQVDSLHLTGLKFSTDYERFQAVLRPAPEKTMDLPGLPLALFSFLLLGLCSSCPILFGLMGVEKKKPSPSP
jgi:hypothetical protein